MRTVIAAFLLLFASSARAEIGFINFDKAMNDCVDGKAFASKSNAEQVAHDKEKATKKAAAGDEEKWRAGQDKKRQEAASKIGVRLGRVIKVVGGAKRLSAVVAGALYVSPKAIDITDEVIRRYDAGEGSELDAQIAAEEARLAELRKTKAAQKKAPAAAAAPKPAKP